MSFYVVVRLPSSATESTVEQEALRLLCDEHKDHSNLSLVLVAQHKKEDASDLALVMDSNREAKKISSKTPKTALRLALLAVGRSALDGDLKKLLEEAKKGIALRKKQIEQLARLEALEKTLGVTIEKKIPSEGVKVEKKIPLEGDVDRNDWNYSEQTERVAKALANLKMPFKAVRTRMDYYNTPLEDRANYVGAQNVQQMLKMVVVENSRNADATDVPTIMAVLVQYAGEGFNTKKLNVFFRQFYKQSKNKTNFRLCDRGEELTGFLRNGICPFGSLLECPVVLDASIEQRLPQEDVTVWLGGGEVDVKINVPWKELSQWATHLVPLS